MSDLSDDMTSNLGAAPAAASHALLARLYDTRVVSKPKKLGNDGSEWADYEFDLKNFMLIASAT